MPLHLHLPHFHIHRKRHPHGARKSTRFTDAEAGRRNIPPATLVQRMDDGFNDSSALDIEQPVKTIRLLPIFSGIMIPFSIMLSIPSLIGHWYIRTENNVTTDNRPNSLLLDVALAFSMACAVLASAFLVIRFAERCVKHMTLASIAFLTLHDLINIPAVTIFGVIHRIDDGFTYGQSFWFTVCSTIIATGTNITLIVDYVTTKDFATSGSGLTSKQRSLVIIVMVLLSYVSLGSFIESKLLDTPFLNALYFSVASLESIGFGDIYPISTNAKIFTCFYIAGGIMNIALAVSIARDVILESTVVEFQQRLKVRQHERRLRSRWRAAIRWRLRERGLPIWIHHHSNGAPEDHPHHDRWYDWSSRIFESLSRFVSRKQEDPAWRFQRGSRQRRLNIEALTNADWNAAAFETGAPLSQLIPEEVRMRRQHSADRSPGVTTSDQPTVENGEGRPAPHSLTHFRLGGMLSIVGNFAMAVSHDEKEPGITQETTDSDDIHPPQPEMPSSAVVEKGDGEESNPAAPHGVPLSISTTIQEDDRYTEASLEMDAKQMFTARLYIALSLFFTFWLAGSAIFMKTEKWTFWTAAYFCFICFTTVGYGDISPKSPAGRSIFVVWALLGVATMTILVSVLMEAFSQRFKNVIRSEVYQLSRIPLSARPTLSIETDQGLVSASSAYPRRTRDSVSHENGKSTARIRIRENTFDAPVESSSTTEFQVTNHRSVLIQVDHLKSLITMARAQCESNASSQLETLILHLESKLDPI